MNILVHGRHRVQIDRFIDHANLDICRFVSDNIKKSINFALNFNNKMPEMAKNMAQNTNYQIATTPEALQKAFAVRAIVFVEEQGVSYEEEIDGYDYSSIHFLATINNEPIGAARLRLFKDYVKIGRLAVRKAYRGQGIGKELFAFVLDYIAKMEYQKITLHAQAYLVKFYEDFGFVKRGEMFLEADIEHYYMEKITTK